MFARIQVDRSDAVELRHAFRGRGHSAIRTRVARILRKYEQERGREPGREHRFEDWYYTEYDEKGKPI